MWQGPIGGMCSGRRLSGTERLFSHDPKPPGDLHAFLLLLKPFNHSCGKVLTASIVLSADMRSPCELWRNICLPGFLTFSLFLFFLSLPATQGNKSIISEKILLGFIV